MGDSLCGDDGGSGKGVGCNDGQSWSTGDVGTVGEEAAEGKLGAGGQPELVLSVCVLSLGMTLGIECDETCLTFAERLIVAIGSRDAHLR